MANESGTPDNVSAKVLTRSTAVSITQRSMLCIS